MKEKLIPERLQNIRMRLGINKAEAARLLDLTKMGYGRYESGERSPSFQSISFMADVLGTSVAYLTGETEDPSPDAITIRAQEEPDLFSLAAAFRAGNPPCRSAFWPTSASCRRVKNDRLRGRF